MMNKNLLRLILIGGIGYLFYKYYYLPNKAKKDSDNLGEDLENINDGRTTFYGDTKDDYVRGFPLPDNINDIKVNEIDVITKPKQSLFNNSPRTMFKIGLVKNNNDIVYFDKTNLEWVKHFAKYDEVKDKLVMNQEYTK